MQVPQVIISVKDQLKPWITPRGNSCEFFHMYALTQKLFSVYCPRGKYNFKACLPMQLLYSQALSTSHKAPEANEKVPVIETSEDWVELNITFLLVFFVSDKLAVRSKHLVGTVGVCRIEPKECTWKSL